MLTDPWHLGLVVALFTANVAASYWLYRRFQDGATPPRREADAVDVTTADIDADTAAGGGGPETIRCPACGTANDAEYRFCRLCVAELSASGVAGDGGAGAARGLSR